MMKKKITKSVWTNTLYTYYSPIDDNLAIKLFYFK